MRTCKFCFCAKGNEKMKISTVCNDAKSLCRELPVLSCDCSVKHTLKCKGSKSSLCEMSSYCSGEIPVAVIAIALLGICLASSLCRAMHRRCHRHCEKKN